SLPLQKTSDTFASSTRATNSIIKYPVPATKKSSLVFDTNEVKMKKLQMLTQELKNELEHSANASTITYTDENDPTIDHIYKIGNKHRLFIDYRPDDSFSHSTNQTTSARTFTTQTFRGKLYIDEVYICSGQGSSKRQCKRDCFLRAHDYLVDHDYEVKSLINGKDKQAQYDLVVKDLNEFDGNESFVGGMRMPHMNFVEAKDTSTIAERTAYEQLRLEQQYWQRDHPGEERPTSIRSKLVQRSRSPPPPIPHLPPVYHTLKKDENIIDPIPRQQPSQQSEIIFNAPITANRVKTSSIILEEHHLLSDTLSVSQQRTKLIKLQPFLFSLLNSLADPAHSIDLISSQINKYHLQSDFECPDKPSSTQGFHGYLVVEQIYISDGYGINKKLAKKQTYSNALKLISKSKSFSLELRNKQQWTLISCDDDQGLLKCPPPSRRSMLYRDSDRDCNQSTGGDSRYERAQEYHQAKSGGTCIPPPMSNNNYSSAQSFGSRSRRINEEEAAAPIVQSSFDSSKCVTTPDNEILSNIHSLIPSTFVLFEPLDFQSNMPGSYVSMLFVSMSKNRLELKHDIQHIPKGYLVTFYIDDHFLMSMLGNSNKNCTKQTGAMKLCELLKTIFPCIKMKSVEHMIEDGGTYVILGNVRRITRAHLYEQAEESIITNNNNNQHQTNENVIVEKEDIATKLMKKMGWTGTGGLGKQGQGIAEPIQIEDLHGRKGLGSNHLFPNNIFIRNLRRSLEEYIQQNNDDQELIFENQFNNEERKMIHKEAMKLHLHSTSYGQKQQRFIRVTHKRTTDELMDHLKQHNGKTQRYELKSAQSYQTNSQYHGGGMRTVSTDLLKQGIRIAPVVEYKDACDDNNT
ncbi:unnamed protein product, partial [Didymodactylos carnosus]